MDYLRNFVRDNKDVNFVAPASHQDNKRIQTARVDQRGDNPDRALAGDHIFGNTRNKGEQPAQDLFVPSHFAQSRVHDRVLRDLRGRTLLQLQRTGSDALLERNDATSRGRLRFGLPKAHTNRLQNAPAANSGWSYLDQAND